MIEILKKDKCCGCYACVNMCPKKCISMKYDEEGFAYPVVDKDKCINCGLCEKACPTLKSLNLEKYDYEGYVCYNTNEKSRENSSSGGIFILLCEEIINKNGVVFGAAFDEKFSVRHCYAETLEECEKFKGSKYVQSQIGNTYAEAKKFLEQGKMVLFSGTQCQIKGLNLYLNKKYENLITVDIICHGVPSPMVFEKYKDLLKKEYNSDINRIRFRDKRIGWKKFSFTADFENNQCYTKDLKEDPYLKGFLSNLYLRPSCYECASKNFSDGADISLADYWGVEYKHPEFFDDKGSSLLLVNSGKGKAILEDISDKIKYSKTDLEFAISMNKCIIQPTFKTKRRKDFFEEMNKNGIIPAIEKLSKPTFGSKVKKKMEKVKNKIKSGIKKIIGRK